MTTDPKGSGHRTAAAEKSDYIEGTHGREVVPVVPETVNRVLHGADYTEESTTTDDPPVQLALLVKTKRLEKGLSQEELARRIGISKAAVSSIEIGRTRSLRGPTMAGLMRELGITPEELTGKRPLQRRVGAYTPTPKGGPNEPPPATRIPVVGDVIAEAAGQWIGADAKELLGSIDFHSSDPAAYSLRITGDSLSPRIRSGEFIVCEPGHECMPGDEVLITLANGQVMVRELVYQRDEQTVVNELVDLSRRRTLRDADIATMDFIAAIVKASRFEPH